MSQELLVFNNLYDKYSPLLYGIALELCPTQLQADEQHKKFYPKANYSRGLV